MCIPARSGGGGEAAGESHGARSSSPVDCDPTACTATFTWWQKDAYFDSPGRSHPLWPPHTATELQVTCGAQTIADVSQGNHGSTPGMTDDAGTPMLIDVQQQSITGSLDDMNALVAAYQSCQCDPTTQFLSLDDLPDLTMQQVLTTVLQYLNQNLYCSGSPSTADVVSMIQSGDYVRRRRSRSPLDFSRSLGASRAAPRSRVPHSGGEHDERTAVVAFENLSLDMASVDASRDARVATMVSIVAHGCAGPGLPCERDRARARLLP